MEITGNTVNLGFHNYKQHWTRKEAGEYSELQEESDSWKVFPQNCRAMLGTLVWGHIDQKCSKRPMDGWERGLERGGEQSWIRCEWFFILNDEAAGSNPHCVKPWSPETPAEAERSHDPLHMRVSPWGRRRLLKYTASAITHAIYPTTTLRPTPNSAAT